MKKQINDLLLKMQTGENCIGETANALLILYSVSNSFNLEIKDRDIATIEAMHDTLLDEKVLGLNARSMKESRDLTQRMYEALSKD
jgi:hypothetical protein